MLLLNILGNRPRNFPCFQLPRCTVFVTGRDGHSTQGRPLVSLHLSSTGTHLVSGAMVKFAKLSQQCPDLDQSQSVERKPHGLAESQVLLSFAILCSNLDFPEWTESWRMISFGVETKMTFATLAASGGRLCSGQEHRASGVSANLSGPFIIWVLFCGDTVGEGGQVS